MTSVETPATPPSKYRRLIVNGRAESRAGLLVPEASTTTTALRQRNRAVVLKRIILDQETTRADIARASGLSAASAANIVTELINEGLVEERGSRSSQGGRPIAVVGPRAERAIMVGIDVGERGIAAEVFDLAMNRIDREFRGGKREESPALIAADIHAALEALEARNIERWGTLIGIGLGLPGIVETDAAGVQTLYAQSLGWDPVSVADLCPQRDVPVFADNGAKLLARAELWLGNAKHTDHAVVAMLGRGVGAGIINAGEIATGSHSGAGEWGHTALQVGGRSCRCGNRGCVEAYLGADAIIGRWVETGADVSGTGWNAITSLVDAERAGDPRARALVADVVEELGAALGNLINLTNPTKVLIGGWVGERLFTDYESDIDAAIKRHTLRRPASQYTLAKTRFAGDAVAAGGALLPLEALVLTGWSTSA